VSGRSKCFVFLFSGTADFSQIAQLWFNSSNLSMTTIFNISSAPPNTSCTAPSLVVYCAASMRVPTAFSINNTPNATSLSASIQVCVSGCFIFYASFFLLSRPFFRLFFCLFRSLSVASFLVLLSFSSSPYLSYTSLYPPCIFIFLFYPLQLPSTFYFLPLPSCLVFSSFLCAYLFFYLRLVSFALFFLRCFFICFLYLRIDSSPSFSPTSY
jgi:hypothetical protein